MAHTSKRCPTCGLEKALDKFYRNATRADGRSAHCSACESDRLKRYHATPAGKAANKAAWAKSMAKARERFAAEA